MPFPSSFYEVADASTPTGRRLAISADATPLQLQGARLDVTHINRADGWSPATPLLVHLTPPPPAASLPPETDVAASLLPSSKVVLFDMDRGERVPLWAELDANATDDTRRALLIQPAVTLAPNTRYAVALIDLGAAPTPFAALRDQRPLSKALRAMQSNAEEVFTFLAAHDIARASLTLAYDFHTASEAAAMDGLAGMRDTLYAMSDALTVTVGTVTDAPTAYAVRTIELTYDVPSFLADDSGAAPLVLDGNGKPMMRALTKVSAYAVIPRCASPPTGPMPVVIFGSGLFLNAKDLLSSGIWQRVAGDACAIYIGTDLIGLSSNDLGIATDAAVNDINKIYLLTDRLQQAQINVLALARVAKTKLAALPAFSVDGAPAVDPTRTYYFGISNGGIQGSTLLALGDDIERGVLNVPGCKWTLMLTRSSNFAPFSTFLKTTLPDPLEQLLLFGLSATEWDHADPALYARHVTHDPLPGRVIKQVLVQEAIGDAQVANVSTRILARELAVPALSPLVQPVFGVTEQPAPLSSAYTQWDSHTMPLPPPGNTSLPKDNWAHNSIWPSRKGVAQVTAFFAASGGQVVDVCGGACTDY